MTCLAEYPSLFQSPSVAGYNAFNTLVVSFFSLSLAENALATGLIVYKILTVYRDIRGLGCPKRLGRDIVPIISIMIESGVITLTAQLVQTLMYKFDITAFPLLTGLVVQLYVRVSQSIVDLMVFDYIYPIMQGISTAIVLVRVQMGLTYEVDNKTSIIRFATSNNHDTTLT